jgi:hypothetical protein
MKCQKPSSKSAELFTSKSTHFSEGIRMCAFSKCKNVVTTDDLYYQKRYKTYSYIYLVFQRVIYPKPVVLSSRMNQIINEQLVVFWRLAKWIAFSFQWVDVSVPSAANQNSATLGSRGCCCRFAASESFFIFVQNQRDCS